MNYKNVRKIVFNSFKNVDCKIKEFKNEDMIRSDIYLDNALKTHVIKRGLRITLEDSKFVNSCLYFLPDFKLRYKKKAVRVNHRVLCIYYRCGEEGPHDEFYGSFDEDELEKNIPGFLECAMRFFTKEQELENMVNSQEYQNYLNHTNL